MRTYPSMLWSIRHRAPAARAQLGPETRVFNNTTLSSMPCQNSCYFNVCFLDESVWRESQRWVALFRGEPLNKLGVMVNGASGPRITQLIPALCRMALNVQSRL